MTRSRSALEGLPHSEISGSKPVCGSPELIAAYHVLHRRPAPRHPPYALSSLTTTFTLLKTSCFCCLLSIYGTAIYGFDAKLQLFRIFGCQGAAGSWPAFPRWLTPPIDARAQTRVPIAGFRVGGAGRARTGDFRLAKAALSQLSYSPRRPGSEKVGGPKWI
jgi:hypothetical protein